MVNVSTLVKASEVLDKEPEIGDFVLYFVRNPKEKVLQSQVGVIVRETTDDGFIINGRPRFKDQVLFVLTLPGYQRQQRLSDSSTL